MLSIACEATPADAIAPLVDDLRLSSPHCQIKVAVVGIDAVLYFSPKKDGDGLIVDVNGFTVFSHRAARQREETSRLPPVVNPMVVW